MTSRLDASRKACQISSTRPSTLDESLSLVATIPGTYYVKVASASGTFSDSSYTLQVTLVEPTPTPTPTPTATPTPTVTLTPDADAEPDADGHPDGSL